MLQVGILLVLMSFNVVWCRSFLGHKRVTIAFYCCHSSLRVVIAFGHYRTYGCSADPVNAMLGCRHYWGIEIWSLIFSVLQFSRKQNAQLYHDTRHSWAHGFNSFVKKKKNHILKLNFIFLSFSTGFSWMKCRIWIVFYRNPFGW